MPPDDPAEIPTEADSAIARSARAADIGAWTWNTAADRITLSDQAAHLLGCLPSQPIAYVDMLGLFHLDDRAAADTEWRASQAAGGRFDFDLRTAADGRRLRVRGRFSGDNASGILLDAGRFGAALDDAVIDPALDGTVTNWNQAAQAMFGYTAAKRAPAALREREALSRSLLIHMSRLTEMGEMASTLAHEINQPLTAVVSYLSGCRRLLKGRADADAVKLRDAIERARDQALRAGQIIRRLRPFVVRSESEPTAEGLANLIEEACALALADVRETGVRVSIASDPGIADVLVDRVQIQQVLLNLMRNAIEAMSKDARRVLTIATVRRDDGMAEISVADTGPGIAPEVARHLFQPFVTAKPRGLGIGLAIARAIVENHGGTLWAEANPGGGTIFRFTVRIDQGTATGEATGAADGG